MANSPISTVIVDTGTRSTISCVANFNAATNSNTTIIQANTLWAANNAQPCYVTVQEVQYSTSLANGYISLYYVGDVAANNQTILNYGRNSSGVMEAYTPNYLKKNQLPGGLGGDIGLTIQNAGPNDTFSLVIKVIKTAGFSNAETDYNIQFT